MKRGFTSSVANQANRFFATNSGPLSERICLGTPCVRNRSASTKMTSSERMRLATKLAKHSLEYSSIEVSACGRFNATAGRNERHSVRCTDTLSGFLLTRPNKSLYFRHQQNSPMQSTQSNCRCHREELLWFLPPTRVEFPIHLRRAM